MSTQMQLFTRLKLDRQPEVTSSNPLKMPLCTVFKQFNTLVLNFGTFSSYSSLLVALLQFFDSNCEFISLTRLYNLFGKFSCKVILDVFILSLVVKSSGNGFDLFLIRYIISFIRFDEGGVALFLN